MALVSGLALLVLLGVASANKVNPANSARHAQGNNTLFCDVECQTGELHHLGMNKVMPLKTVEFDYCRLYGGCPTNLKAVADGVERCINGFVDVHQNAEGTGRYACHNVDLLSYVSAKDLGSALDTSDIWGAEIELEDGKTRYLAIVGHADGTSFVDITRTVDPVILGFLPTFDCGNRNIPGVCTKGRIWRDIKVYGNKAYIVSENYGHGMQVVDLLALFGEDLAKGHVRAADVSAPQTLQADYHYNQFGKAHNIALNEDTGFAYVIGSNTCKGGLHVIDVHEDQDHPLPTFAGCFDADGYTHDCQCLTYKKSFPDQDYHGHEICLNFNEDTLTIVDVTDKNDMRQISRISYHGVQYTHQGWLTEDGKYVLMDDELDEQVGSTYRSNADTEQHGGRTRTLIWNVEDLDNPVWVHSFISEQTAIDHNLYIKNKKAYQSNYCAGLRVLDVSDPRQPREHAYFDLAPYCSGASFEGTWSNYPYYDHPENHGDTFQIVAVSSIERGLYVLRVHLHE